MTYLLTEEDHKTLREALKHSHPNEPIWKTPHREALAILDKLQRVEVVKSASVEANGWTFNGKLRKRLYAVKE